MSLWESALVSLKTLVMFFSWLECKNIAYMVDFFVGPFAPPPSPPSLINDSESPTR